jgi:hypothetical protein
VITATLSLSSISIDSCGESVRSNTEMPLRLQPFEAFGPSSGPRPVGRGLSPEFVPRMVNLYRPDDKRYFVNLR